MFFKQIQHHGDNFSYLIADQTTKEAAVIDSSYNSDVLQQIIKQEGFTIKYIINTHEHSDHTAGNPQLKATFNAKIAAHKAAKTKSDLQLNDKDTLNIGAITIQVIHTPGHTPDGICLLIDNKKLLTGDTLFVGECGRTDLIGGNPKDLYNSLFNKIAKLTDNIEVYPGHNYGATSSSTIGKEKQTNYVLQPRTLKDFLEFMSQP
jgi:hydroxyacylglutathione hydrolase